MSDVLLEQVIALAMQLSPIEKARLMERVASTLETDLSISISKPLETFEGALAHLGAGPTDADIDEIRISIWGS